MSDESHEVLPPLAEGQEAKYKKPPLACTFAEFSVRLLLHQQKKKAAAAAHIADIEPQQLFDVSSDSEIEPSNFSSLSNS